MIKGPREILSQHFEIQKQISKSVSGDEKFRYNLEKTMKNIIKVFGETNDLQQSLYNKEYFELRKAKLDEEKQLLDAFSLKDENGVPFPMKDGKPAVTDEEAYQGGMDAIAEKHSKFVALEKFIQEQIIAHSKENIEVEVFGVYEEHHPPLMTLDEERYMKSIGLLKVFEEEQKKGGQKPNYNR
jgi:hypothetical protein